MSDRSTQQQREDYYSYHQITSSQTGHKGGGINHSGSQQQVIALATLVPVGAGLLILAGLTLTLTVIGLAITTPLFVFFSPVLVPATLIIGFAIAGVLTSGAFGLTSLSSFAWLASYLRRTRFLDRLKQHAKPHPREEEEEEDINLGGYYDYHQAQAQHGSEDVRDRVVETKAQEMVREAQSDAAPPAREVGKAQKVNRTST